MIHVFRWDRTAIAVPREGRSLDRKFRKGGAWMCVMCRILLDFAVAYDLDHYDDCPGGVE